MELLNRDELSLIMTFYYKFIFIVNELLTINRRHSMYSVVLSYPN